MCGIWIRTKGFIVIEEEERFWLESYGKTHLSDLRRENFCEYEYDYIMLKIVNIKFYDLKI